MKAYVYLLTSMYTEGTVIHPFPVVAVVLSRTDPTQLAFIKDMQTATQELQTFEDAGLFWKKAEAFNDGRVFILASHPHTPSTDRLVLPHLSREEFIAQQQNDDVPAVEVKYNGEDHMWNRVDGSSKWYVGTLVEDGELTAAEGAELRELFVAKYLHMKKSFMDTKRRELEAFDQMVVELASRDGTTADDILTSLDDMKVFKIYPTGLPQPQPCVFNCRTGGVQCDLVVNPFCKADEYLAPAPQTCLRTGVRNKTDYQNERAETKRNECRN